MEFFAFVAFIVTISIIGSIINNMINHRHKLAEVKLQQLRQGDESLVEEVRALKQQLTDLRDSSTRYDMSIESALQRLESRVMNVEQRVTRVEQGAGVAQTSRS